MAGQGMHHGKLDCTVCGCICNEIMSYPISAFFVWCTRPGSTSVVWYPGPTSAQSRLPCRACLLEADVVCWNCSWSFRGQDCDWWCAFAPVVLFPGASSAGSSVHRIARPICQRGSFPRFVHAGRARLLLFMLGFLALVLLRLMRRCRLLRIHSWRTRHDFSSYALALVCSSAISLRCPGASAFSWTGAFRTLTCGW